jgi:ABC-type lipoprotein release transport system permease subunit
MKTLIALAWKNLSRYKKRTIITASALAFGLAIFIFFDSWLLGMELDSERNLIWYETASAKIFHDEYWDKKENAPLKYTIDNPQNLINSLEEINIDATARTVFSGEIILRRDPFPEDGSVMLNIIGINPETDDNVFRFRETITSGDYLNEGEHGILMGAWLADKIGAEVGFSLIIVTRTKTGFRQTIDVEITGIVDCPNPYINKGAIFIPIDVADLYLEMDGTVTEIDLNYPELSDVDKISEDITEALKLETSGLDILTWKKIVEAYVALAKMKQSGSLIVLFLVFIIAAVGISNTMLMSIYERKREIGMMRALGMKDSEIKRAFKFEAAGIGLIGSIIGVIIGIGLCVWIIYEGVDFTSMVKDMDIGYRITGIFRGAWHLEAIIGAFLFGIVLSVIVSIMPVRKVLKKRITECLRNE